MPDMNGEEVMDNIKLAKPDLPVLLFSVYHDDDATLSANIRKKAAGIISKPIDHTQLRETINKVLQK